MGAAALAALLPAAVLLAQAEAEGRGPGSWSFRNWLGLGCQVTVFLLLVALIFWLADLGGREEPGEGGATPAPGPTPPPVPPAAPDAGGGPSASA